MKVKSEGEVAQSFPTLCDPMDCSPPGSSIHGIFQARVLEWGAIAFSDLGANMSKGKNKDAHTGEGASFFKWSGSNHRKTALYQNALF